MIKEDYVSFETAKLLKDKGFEGDINAYYHIWDNGNKVCSVLEFSRSEAPHLYISAPTLQMAMKWLREIYKIHIILRISRNTFLYGFKIVDNKGNVPYVNNFVFDAYEEAVEAGIKYSLENLT